MHITSNMKVSTSSRISSSLMVAPSCWASKSKSRNANRLFAPETTRLDTLLLPSWIHQNTAPSVVYHLHDHWANPFFPPNGFTCITRYKSSTTVRLNSLNRLVFGGVSKVAKSDCLIRPVFVSQSVVCLSVCPNWTTRLPLDGISRHLVFEYFS